MTMVTEKGAQERVTLTGSRCRSLKTGRYVPQILCDIDHIKLNSDQDG